jgi:hypothetical protein
MSLRDRLPSPHTAAVFMLGFQLVSLVLWITMTVIVELSSSLQHSLPYLVFVSNWALVSASLAGVVAGMSALWAERSSS